MVLGLRVELGDPLTCSSWSRRTAAQVVAWRPGSPAYRVPMDGRPATLTETVLGEDATWQRTAP